MEKLKKILIYGLNALLLTLIGLALVRIGSYDGLLQSQRAAVFWAGDSGATFAQVSCFFPADRPAALDSVLSFRGRIDAKLAGAGVEPKKESEGKHWTDCYSTQDTLTVEGERNSSAVTVFGVGGNFFLFHPYALLSGSYIYEDDVMQDRVVLDYELAWKLFGGTDLAGMTVRIDGKPYYIAGVVRRETDKFSDKAYSGEAALYMPYSTLASLRADSETGISSYELAMPDPLTGFAKTFVQESFENDGGVVVENSGRYSFQSIFSIFTNFGDRAISANGVSYPYWENAARISEVYIARLYACVALLALYPLVCLGILLVRLFIRLRARAKRLKSGLWDAWDDRYARQAAWKARRAQRRAGRDVKQPAAAREKPGKERKAQKRRVRTAEARKRAEEPDTEAFDGAVAADIESIVREIMAEKESASPKEGPP
ncbi:MAG: ABC transporter permease [Oscillospiraceae bacterium]|nr:ABC transporter permease [Oscillospiraceae bacterium]